MDCGQRSEGALLQQIKAQPIASGSSVHTYTYGKVYGLSLAKDLEKYLLSFSSTSERIQIMNDKPIKTTYHTEQLTSSDSSPIHIQ